MHYGVLPTSLSLCLCAGLLHAVFAPPAAIAQTTPSDPGATSQPTSDTEPINILEGIVVDKATGTPQSKVTVVMARPGKAWVMVDAEGAASYHEQRSESEGEDEAAPARNHRYALKTRTDENGRFRLRNFAEPGAEYTIYAKTKSRGVALLRKVVPEKYAAEPLRIELEQPASISILLPKYFVPRRATTYLSISPEPEIKGYDADGAPEYDQEAANVHLSLETENGSRRAECHWLVPGVKYRVKAAVYKTGMSSTCAVREQIVTAAAGEQLKLFEDPTRDEALPKGATLTGTISDKDGKKLKDVNVRVCLGAGRATVYGAVTDSQGAYEIPHLPPGQYRLELEHYRKRTAPG